MMNSLVVEPLLIGCHSVAPSVNVWLVGSMSRAIWKDNCSLVMAVSLWRCGAAAGCEGFLPVVMCRSVQQLLPYSWTKLDWMVFSSEFV
jgi:hypothetical protein